jgi:hypothetical protein
VGRRSLAHPRRTDWIPDGQHLALLVGKGDQLFPPASLPVAGSAGLDCIHCATVLECGHVPGSAGIHVLGDLGAGGVWLVTATAQKAARSTLSLAGGRRTRLIETIIGLQIGKGLLCTELP